MDDQEIASAIGWMMVASGAPCRDVVEPLKWDSTGVRNCLSPFSTSSAPAADTKMNRHRHRGESQRHRDLGYTARANTPAARHQQPQSVSFFACSASGRRSKTEFASASPVRSTFANEFSLSSVRLGHMASRSRPRWSLAPTKRSSMFPANLLTHLFATAHSRLWHKCEVPTWSDIRRTSPNRRD